MAKKQNNGNTIVAKIISEFKSTQRAEIRKWRQAINFAKHPETPRAFLLQDLYENLETDGHYISQVEIRKSATLCSDFSIVDRKSGGVNPEKTELLQDAWFYDFLENVLDSIFKGYTLLELTDPSTMEFEVIPRRNVVAKHGLVLFEANGDRGIDYTKGFEKTLIKVGKADNLGLMNNLCGQLIWKRNAQQSWAEYSEKFGMPLVTATTNKTSPADVASIKSMLIELGEAARAVLPEGTTIDIKPFSGSDAYNVYLKQIEAIDKEISKTITGGTMISDDGSSRAQSEVHERTLDEKLSARDRLICEFVVNKQLLPIMQAWGWDVNPATDKFAFDNVFELSVKEHWDVIRSALNFYEIPDEWISQTFNFPIDKRREQPLNAMSVMAQGGGLRNVIAGKELGGLSANFR